ncbi:MAG TPA: serine/threonine-protein kinase [Kofleriaceae bacterium]|nr:serine/threonine-protein kinase [Kofleriaceae bacterium]
MSRLRFVAPPGMDAQAEEVKTIGRYEIVQVVGKGAMGVVYKARDPLLDRIVAVKTIVSPQGVGKRVRTAYLERFEREAKAAAKMQHPAIVTIFDVGVDNGAPYMVLEYLPGETLADRLDRVRMPLSKAVPVATELASALGFAHKQRIVHRDMKPANVLHAGEGHWKLADFGIARLPDSDLTQVGIFMGTPGYSPPEAIKEGRYTPQADVFAWGAVLYELLSGYIPYEGPDTQTTNGYVLKATAPSPRKHDPSIPEPLAEVAMRALSPSTDIRYKDGHEAEKALKTAWEQCLKGNLVSTASLAGDEVPHERVGAEMHSSAGIEALGVAATVPAPTLKDPTPASPPPTPGAPGKPMLVIESGKVASDDDPTTILIRDSGPTKVDDHLEDSGVVDTDDRKPTTAEPVAARRTSDRSSASQPSAGPAAPASTRLYVLVLLLALTIGGAAAWYYLRGGFK